MNLTNNIGGNGMDSGGSLLWQVGISCEHDIKIRFP